MTDEEMKHFVDTVAASTVANKAILTLYMAGRPITPENAAITYGRWIDPQSSHYERLVRAVHAQVCEMIDTAVELSPPAQGNA